MIGWLFEFMSKPRFSFGDLLLFYIIYTDIWPWVKRKWAEHKKLAWTCPYCERRKKFRVSSNTTTFVQDVGRDHIFKFHPEKIP